MVDSILVIKYVYSDSQIHSYWEYHLIVKSTTSLLFTNSTLGSRIFNKSMKIKVKIFSELKQVILGDRFID